MIFGAQLELMPADLDLIPVVKRYLAGDASAVDKGPVYGTFVFNGKYSLRITFDRGMPPRNAKVRILQNNIVVSSPAQTQNRMIERHHSPRATCFLNYKRLRSHV